MNLAIGWGIVVLGIAVGAAMVAFPAKRKSPSGDEK
jgi:hypothetical protein